VASDQVNLSRSELLDHHADTHAESWLAENVWHPFVNGTGVKQIINTVSNEQLLPEHVPQVATFSTDWAAQTLLSAGGAVLSYALAGKLAGAALVGIGAKLELEGAFARFVTSNTTAQISGAGLYDFAKAPTDGETRLGNAAGTVAAFRAFGWGNDLIGRSSLIAGNGLLSGLGRAAVGSIGGLTSLETSNFVSSLMGVDKDISWDDRMHAMANGGFVNFALPPLQNALTKAVDHSINSQPWGKGVPIERFVKYQQSSMEARLSTLTESGVAPSEKIASLQEQLDALKHPGLAQLAFENPLARVKVSAKSESSSADLINNRVNLKEGDGAGKLAHELEHLTLARQAEPAYKDIALLAKTDPESAEAQFLARRAGMESKTRVTENIVSGKQIAIENPALIGEQVTGNGKTYAENWKAEFQQLLADPYFRPSTEYDASKTVVAKADSPNELMDRIRSVMAQNPTDQPELVNFVKTSGTGALKSLQANGAITEDQARILGGRFWQQLRQYSDSLPEDRFLIMRNVREMNAQLKHIADLASANKTTQAQDYADVAILSSQRPALRIPTEALRNATPEALNFYFHNINEVAPSLRRPPDTASGGARYEYASQRMLMDLLGKTDDAELKKYAFLPGLGGSSADRIGIDGILLNLTDNTIVPMDFKNSPNVATYRYTIHFPSASDAPADFNKRWSYSDKDGKFAAQAKPDDYTVEKQLKDRIKDYRHPALPGALFQDFNPASQVAFPSLSDAADIGRPSELATQAAALQQFADSSKATELQYFVSKAGKSIGYLKLAKQEAQAAIDQGELSRLKPLDAGVTVADLSVVRDLRVKLLEKGETYTDKDVLTTMKAFRNLGISPDADDVQKYTDTTSDAAKPAVAYEGFLRQLGNFTDQLRSSRDPGSRSLADWASILQDKGQGAADASLAQEVASDADSKAQLNQLLDGFYAQRVLDASSRRNLVDRARQTMGAAGK